MGAEISPWGWKFHARLILGSQRAVPIMQGQRLKEYRVSPYLAVQGGYVDPQKDCVNLVRGRCEILTFVCYFLFLSSSNVYS